MSSPHDQLVVDDKKLVPHGSLNAAAKGTETQALSPTSLNSFKLYLVLLVPSMGGICVGYDISVMNYINGMEPYLRYFGLDGQTAGGGVGPTTGLIFGMYTLGTCLAVLLAGPICDRFGRRGGMFVGSVFCLAGAITVSIAKDVQYLKAGRFLLGMSAALLEVAGSTFVAELSPPQWRGRLTGLFGAIAIVSTIVSGAVTIVTGRMNTSASWRIPLCLQVIPAAGVFVFSYFIPESPRWLMSVGRKEEGREVLAKYHGNGDHNAPLVALECKEFEESIKLDASKKPWWNYAGLFRTRSDRSRTFLVFLLACCGQWAGSGLSSFLVVLLAEDHVNTQNMRLILSLVSGIVSALGALTGASISDKVGRRTIWFWGNVSCTVALIISAACTAKFGTSGYNSAGSNTAIAFLFLFTFFFCATYVPLPPVYASECMSFENRANGVALYTFVASSASLVNTLATPIALGSIGWRLYLVFIGWDIVACVLIWIFAVETSGRTLEELNEVFEVSAAFALIVFETRSAVSRISTQCRPHASPGP
ncbi:general substrate transporter [Mycena filopes]|nr:general substrate transporter [Mycena filopes]